MKTIFCICELSGHAWECAIKNVHEVLKRTDSELGEFDMNKGKFYEGMAVLLRMRFDANGKLI